MAIEISSDISEFIRIHRVARLATADANAHPAVIPVCYVFDGARIYSPLDEKPKSVAAQSLKRVRNIEANPRVALLIDDYCEDWSNLQYVLVSGVAEIVEPGGEEHARAVTLLRDKYHQYQAMAIESAPIIKITPTRIKQWSYRGSESTN
jgi:PPOX class probable F420-dependent enzyme